MISDILRSGDVIYSLIMFLLSLPVILIALTVHECAHGYIAYKMGDPTARNLGRLSLNPVKHLDPIGALMMLIFGFGWAKPVPINSRHFKNPKWGMALSALAGPVSNFLLAFIGYFLFFLVSTKLYITATIISTLKLFLFIFYSLNLSLAVFNLLPVPPLDGSRILFVLLPSKYYFGIMKYERYISLGLMIALFTGVLNRPLGWIVGLVETLFYNVVNLIL